MGYDTGFNNGSDRHKYITDEVANEIRKRCTVYEKKDFHKLKKKYTDAFGDFDYIVELTDFDYVIEINLLTQPLHNRSAPVSTDRTEHFFHRQQNPVNILLVL